MGDLGNTGIEANRATAIGRSQGRCGPVLLQLIVQPGQRQRRTGHIQRGHQFTHLRHHQRVTGFAQQGSDGAPEDEKLLMLGGTQAIEDHSESPGSARRSFVQDPAHQFAAKFDGGRQLGIEQSRLAVDTQPKAHLSLGKAEQRLVGAWESATAKRGANGSRQPIRLASQTNHCVEVKSCFGSSTHDLEDHEIPGNAAPLPDLPG
ncbi:hypothetical protein PJL18_04355 [Paenarthrobacter nicotinovorans]|nr:hypothetical protein [Paenarthrobacter nicotinovorans]